MKHGTLKIVAFLFLLAASGGCVTTSPSRNANAAAYVETQKAQAAAPEEKQRPCKQVKVKANGKESTQRYCQGDNGEWQLVTADSGASIPTKSTTPSLQRHITAPVVAIPIKSIEVSSNAEGVKKITESSCAWCSATGKLPYKNDTARWMKVHFDGTQTLNALRLDPACDGPRFILSFSDGSRQTTEVIGERGNLIPLGDRETEWVKIQYLDEKNVIYGRVNEITYVNRTDRQVCCRELFFTGRDKSASPAYAPETAAQLGDDRMPFEAGSFVWKGGKEDLGDIPMFLSRGKVFIAADSGLYTFADAMSWCEGRSGTGVQWRKPTPEDFRTIKDLHYRNLCGDKYCQLNEDFGRYFGRNGWKGGSTLVNHDDVARLRLGAGDEMQIDFTWGIEINKPVSTSNVHSRDFIGKKAKERLVLEREHSFYRPICVARNLGDGDIQATARVVARNDLQAKCAASGKLSRPVKQTVSPLTRGEFEKTADFERRKRDAERQAEQDYQQALKRHAQARQTANAACEKEKRAQSRGWSIHYSSAAFNAVMGRPQIRSVTYDADAEVFDLDIAGGESSASIPFKAPVKIKYAQDFKKLLQKEGFTPTVHMRVDNDGEIRIAYVEELQNPEDRVINTAWSAAQGNVGRLNAFIGKFPEDKKRVAEARQQIDNIKKAQAQADEAMARFLLWGAGKAVQSVREAAEWGSEHCKTISVDGKAHQVCQ